MPDEMDAKSIAVQTAEITKEVIDHEKEKEIREPETSKSDK